MDIGLFTDVTKAMSQLPLAELGEAIPRDVVDFRKSLIAEQEPFTAEEEKMAVDNLPTDDDEMIAFEIEAPIIQSITKMELPTVRSEKAAIQSVKQPKKPKRRIVQDEIDDIFG